MFYKKPTRRAKKDSHHGYANTTNTVCICAEVGLLWLQDPPDARPYLRMNMEGVNGVEEMDEV